MNTARCSLWATIIPMLLTLASCTQQANDGTIPGDILVSGQSGKRLSNGKLIAFQGYTRMPDGKLSNKSNAFSLVLVYSKDSPIIGSGSKGGSGSNEWVFNHTEIWNIQLSPGDYSNTKGEQLTLSFDGRTKTVNIANTAFNLSRGKLFIVNMSKDWKAETIQVEDDLTATTLPDATRIELREALSNMTVRAQQ